MGGGSVAMFKALRFERTESSYPNARVLKAKLDMKLIAPDLHGSVHAINSVMSKFANNERERVVMAQDHNLRV